MTLGTWGVIVLVLLLALSASGWIFYALSRGRQRDSGKVVSHPPSAPLDPAEKAFLAAAASESEMAFLVRNGSIQRATLAPGSQLAGLEDWFHGRNFLSLFNARDLLPAAEAVRSLDRGDKPTATLTFQLELPAGSPVVHARARLAVPGEAPARVWIASLTDITDEAEMARTAAQMEARLSLALGHLSDGILVCAMTGRRTEVVLANEQLPTVLGLTARPGLLSPGSTLSELRAEVAARHGDELAELLFSDLGENSRRDLTLDTIPPRLVERTVRILGNTQQPTGLLIAFKDLTRERDIQEQLRRESKQATGARRQVERRHEEIVLANEGLERMMSEFAKVNRELKGLDEMKSNLLGNVTHELQTPLVSIKGYTEMILKGRLGPLTDEQERGLKVSLKNADRLIAMIDGLLAFVRSEKDATPLNLEVFPLKPLVEETMNLLSELAEEKELRISQTVPAHGLQIRGDRGRLSQVFINLIGNAIKYNRRKGTISIQAAVATGGVARVEIKDTGVGIPPEDLDRIFDRFYRSGESPEKGSGLGLAITKDILRLHGCKIRADSTAGKGSTFSFTLPLESRSRAERAARLAGTDKKDG